MDHVVNTDQADYWNAAEARHWIEHDERYDRMLRPFTDHLLEAAGIRCGDTVLDIGCGCGHTTRAAARRANPGDVLGVDLSGPMLERARQVARNAGVDNVRFEQADAQMHAFAGQAFDAAISRFGVMFFDDPMAAFSNLGSALRGAGRITFVCWRTLLENEFIAVPAGAALQHVPLPDLGDPSAPGPFSLADADRIRTVLGDGGFSDIQIDPLREPLWLGADADDAIGFIRGTSFAREVLDAAPPDAAARALDAARVALQPFESDDGVILGSSAWLVCANR